MHKYLLLFLLFVSAHLFAIDSFYSTCCKEELITQISDSGGLFNRKKTALFYQNNGYRLAWDLFGIQQLIEATEERALNYRKKAYHTAQLKQLLSEAEVTQLSHEELATLDLLATDQFFAFAKDLYEGEIDQKRFQELLKEGYKEQHLVWEPNPYKPDYVRDLRVSLQTHLLFSLLQRYVPQEKAYRDLVRAYFRYEKIRFPKVDYLKDLKEGDYGYEVSQLKHYLSVTGDLKEHDPSYLNFPTFDAKLRAAVLRFQKRHYLKQNGIFDRVNVLYAQKSAKEKLAQIRLNIERYKLFPRIHGKTYIVINIPGFWLHFFEDGALIEDIFVVIGREDRPTPIFSDYLEYIVLNPTWSIPQNLMKRDYIALLAEDPGALLEDDIHIYQGGREIDPYKVDWSKYIDYDGRIPYQMIQKAGEKNVLGAMKFIFPNKYNVYLHDTNAKHLTTKRYRLYSSGCIRLSKPHLLLSLLSPYTGYSYERLEEIISSGKTVHIRLRKKIPIHIRYLTVFVDQEGDVNFRKDFYGFDKIQSALLD
ncbi:MAG: hypothetical protein DSZ05_06620 [Sulfurospirillum sp.]|nr:MAG: hypothetical protein DSZ05_06620 [Sulfurospirillum sp.]